VLGGSSFGNNDDNNNRRSLSGVDNVGDGGSTLDAVIASHSCDSGIVMKMTVSTIEGAEYPLMEI
jgi:hypothetical protein